jgi:uncharacterized protein YjiS (DUF1127 family)
MTCTDKVSTFLITIQVPTRRDRPWLEWLSFIPRCYRRMREQQRQHHALLQLDDHLLADIGVSREQALREAGKWSCRDQLLRLYRAVRI